MRPAMRMLHAAAPSAVLLLLAGCAVGPNYQAPPVTLTSGFHAAPATAPAPAAPLETWWTAFNDPGLERVVARVQAQNLDIAQAAARVRQSRAAAKAAGAALLPSLQGQAGISRTQQSLQSPIGEIGRHLPGFERDYNLYEASGAASWEIDLFGGLRREREAALADAKATADQAEAVRVSMTAEAADSYLTARGLQARLAVARRQEAVQKDLAELLQRQVGEGLAPERELHEAEAALQDVRAAIPPLTAALSAQFNRLDVLMGAQPGTWRAELETAAPIPAPPAMAAAEGPAGLLRRRPDVLAAYRLVVLRAAEEVENAFTDLAQQQARAAALTQEVDHLKTARAQAQEAYEGGVISLVEVRDVDRSLLAASDQLAQAQAGAARAAVAGFRALGGGWSAS